MIPSETIAPATRTTPGFSVTTGNGMDVVRAPHHARRRRTRRLLFIGLGLISVAATSLVIARLRPALPSVERGSVWTDTVRRGPMVRQALA